MVDYGSLLLSINGLIDGKDHLKEAHLLNALSLLKAALPERSWAGVYLFNGEVRRLILGPFQGSVACEEIEIGKGVVGECFAKEESILVGDVRSYPNYICCDEAAYSEICVPLHKEGKTVGVLDIDFPKGYSPIEDLLPIEKIARILENFI